jgi:hypothetical protein
MHPFPGVPGSVPSSQLQDLTQMGDSTTNRIVGIVNTWHGTLSIFLIVLSGDSCGGCMKFLSILLVMSIIIFGCASHGVLIN